MILICFEESEKDSWGYANWLVRGYLEQVGHEVRDDAELAYVIEVGISHGALLLYMETPALVDRLLPIMLRVADEATAGKRQVDVEGRTLDETAQIQFRERMAELKELIIQFQAKRSSQSTKPA
jgi:hypothetical protein